MRSTGFLLVLGKDESWVGLVVRVVLNVRFAWCLRDLPASARGLIRVLAPRCMCLCLLLGETMSSEFYAQNSGLRGSIESKRLS